MITREISLAEKNLRHKPSRNPSSLVYSLFPTAKSLTFFLINVKVDLENKVIGFQFEPERSISIMKDSTKIAVMKVMLWNETCLTGKIANLVFGASVEIAPQLKEKRKVCAVKKGRRFSILIFRVYLS